MTEKTKETPTARAPAIDPIPWELGYRPPPPKRSYKIKVKFIMRGRGKPMVYDCD